MRASPESGDAEHIPQRLVDRSEVGNFQRSTLGRKEPLLYHLEPTDTND